MKRPIAETKFILRRAIRRQRTIESNCRRDVNRGHDRNHHKGPALSRARARRRTLEAVRELLQTGDVDLLTGECGGRLDLDPEVCTRCEQELKPGTEIWLELPEGGGLYHRPGEISAGCDSQGVFPFGSDCAKVELAKTSM